MSIADQAFNGTFIVGFKPTVAPNPSCCSDPGVLCANCAAKALSLAGNAQSIVVNADDDLLILPSLEAVLANEKKNRLCANCADKVRCNAVCKNGAPGIEPVGSVPSGVTGRSKLQIDAELDEEEQRAIEKEQRRRLGLSDNDDLLPLPAINWAEEVANRKNPKPSSGLQDNDLLPLPSMTY